MTQPDPSSPAVWIDGHPQLEAIAAAVWEHCRTEDSSLVVDDPRNIAVAALAAVLPASVDRADAQLASLAVNAGRALQDEKRHYEIACQENASLRATIDRVRRLHEALDAETDLTSPHDEITRGAAAQKIAAALDGWTDPAELRRVAAETRNTTETDGEVQQPICKCPAEICQCGHHQAPQPKEADGARVVAYRSALPGAMSIYCTRHTDGLGDGVTPLTSDDLPDGGMCAACGVDVLIPQPKEAP
jgi:hypothetical protein